MKRKIMMFGMASAMLTVLAGCGGGSGSISEASEAEGLWKEGDGVAAMVTASGVTTIVTGLAADVTSAPMYKGSVETNDTAVTGGSLKKMTPGGLSTNYDVVGETVEQGQSLVIKGEDAGSNTVTFNLTYNTDYDRSSSLGLLTGFWGTNATTSLVVGSSGAVTNGYDSYTGCSITGQFSIINSSKNLYRVSLTLSNCAGYAGDFSGYATLADEGGTGNVMLLAASGVVQTAKQVPFARVLTKAETP